MSNAKTIESVRACVPGPVESLIDASDDAIIGKGLDNVILSWNRAAERIYGYSAEEAIGQSIHIIAPPDLTGEQDEFIDRIRRGERIDRCETVRRRKDGVLLSVSISVMASRNEAGEISGALIIARDISERITHRIEIREMEARHRRRLVILDAANRVALDILASRTGVEALRHIAESARSLAGARYAALGVARPDGNGLMEFVIAGLSHDEEEAIGARPTGKGVLGLLLSRTTPLRIDDIGKDPASVGFPPNHPAMSSFLGVPIRSGAEVVGSLYLTEKEGGGPFSDEDELAVEALGAHAAIAIHNLHQLARQRALVSGLIAAQEEERRAIAYDLHDGLTQYVMASYAHFEAYRRAVETGNAERAAGDFDSGVRYLKEAVIESRRLVNGLRSLTLDDLGLAGAVEQLLSDEKPRAGWRNAELVHNISEVRFDKTLETAAYRVVQEAVTNVRKHAKATEVRVSILRMRIGDDAFSLKIEVADNGGGFNPAAKAGDYAHVGLHSMEERVRLLRGEFRLQSAPGEGTSVHAEFPILPPAFGEENNG
jgi:PAS domain S-box-containing protein